MSRVPSACNTRSRAYRANCILPVGHTGNCNTGTHAFVGCDDPTSADDKRDLGIRPPMERVDGLTLRMRQAAWGIANGYSAKTLAVAVGISESAAKAHIESLCTCFNVTSREQALMRILVEGKMSLEELTAEVMP